MDALLLAQEEGVLVGLGLVVGLVYFAVIAVLIVAGWKVMTKAGEPGWSILIPVYNTIVLLRIVGRPLWWVLMFFIPFVNIYFVIVTYLDLAKSFGKDTGFAVGLILLSPIFFPILAFGDARYLGPAGPEPRPGYANLGQGGYGQQGVGQGGYGQQGGYQPPTGQDWGAPPSQPQWGTPPSNPSGGEYPPPPTG